MKKTHMYNFVEWWCGGGRGSIAHSERIAWKKQEEEKTRIQLYNQINLNARDTKNTFFFIILVLKRHSLCWKQLLFFFFIFFSCLESCIILGLPVPGFDTLIIFQEFLSLGGASRRDRGDQNTFCAFNNSVYTINWGWHPEIKKNYIL